MKNKIEWSDKNWKKFIVDQRKRMWLPDTVEKFAKWINLKQGMKVADIGCGLGYLGWIYWKYYGNDGSYVGVDISEKLIKEAEELSKDWAKKGKVKFQKGDAYNLNLKENSFDVVMCQTLLMHLDKPEKAISEMKRILKPGGKILCKEPDNLSASLQVGFSTLPDKCLEEKLLLYKYNYYRFKGKKKLGLGDHTIGNKLTYLLSKAGFTNIDARTNDKTIYMIPPYDLDFQKDLIKNFNHSLHEEEDAEKKYWKKINRRDVLAGGGSEYLLRKYFALVEKYSDLYKKEVSEQIYKKIYHQCNSVNSFYAVIGTKE